MRQKDCTKAEILHTENPVYKKDCTNENIWNFDYSDYLSPTEYETIRTNPRELTPTALVGVGLSLDPEGKER